ncbi:MAG: hypothetical protein V1794_15850 [Candidatus Glassbacteria bacterium]
MARNDKTSKRVASKASKILSSKTSSKAAKSVAGSALTQAADKKSASETTGHKVQRAMPTTESPIVPPKKKK